jgi:hypothetical protein
MPVMTAEPAARVAVALERRTRRQAPTIAGPVFLLMMFLLMGWFLR